MPKLPVLDWHDLFGYATVRRRRLHLAVNGRIVWRHFTRPTPGQRNTKRPNDQDQPYRWTFRAMQAAAPRPAAAAGAAA